MKFCEKCGASNQDSSNYCGKCGALLSGASSEKLPEGAANVLIYYTSIRPDVTMTTYFADWSEKMDYCNGDSKALRLNVGLHVMTLRIGNRAYRKNIIATDDKVVKIFASWDGRAHIQIV